MRSKWIHATKSQLHGHGDYYNAPARATTLSKRPYPADLARASVLLWEEGENTKTMGKEERG
eukprot:4492551-Pyramimonas_sp.AAC.1